MILDLAQIIPDGTFDRSNLVVHHSSVLLFDTFTFTVSPPTILRHTWGRNEACRSEVFALWSPCSSSDVYAKLSSHQWFLSAYSLLLWLVCC